MDTSVRTPRFSAARRVFLTAAVIVGVIGMHSLMSCVTTAQMSNTDMSSSCIPADHSSADHSSGDHPFGDHPFGDHPFGDHDGSGSCVDHCGGVVMTFTQLAAAALTLLGAVLIVAPATAAVRRPAERDRASGTSPPWTTPTLTQLSVLRV